MDYLYLILAFVKKRIVAPKPSPEYECGKRN
jgi:hypothetical protein